MYRGVSARLSSSTLAKFWNFEISVALSGDGGSATELPDPGTHRPGAYTYSGVNAHLSSSRYA